MAAARLRVIRDHLQAAQNKGTNSQKFSCQQHHEQSAAVPGGGGGRYRYTLDGGAALNELQRAEYERNGFIVVKNLVPDEDIDGYARRFDEIATRRVKVPFMAVMKDIAYRDREYSPDAVNKLLDFFLDEQLFSYCLNPKILDVVENIVGPNIMAINTMLINKPPDSGTLSSRHPLHQDLYYFPFRPADRVVCAWTAMERVNRENGCLVAVPGSHQGALLEHAYPEWEGGVNKAYHGIKDVGDAMEKRVFLEMEKGDTVFFHPTLIHGSGANRSQRFRKSISCHYAASECDYIDVTGTVQESIVAEALEMARMRGFPLTNFCDAWRARAQLIRGQRVNM